MDPSPSKKKKPPTRVDCKGNKIKSSTQLSLDTRSICDKERGGTPERTLNLEEPQVFSYFQNLKEPTEFMKRISKEPAVIKLVI
jgi:intein-encoded DNA endonuclease-like protein